MPKDPVTVGPEKHEVLLQKRPMFSGHAPKLGCLCAFSDPDRDIDTDVYVLFLLLYHWEFRLTLKIIAKMLREVVNRVKLGDQHAQRGSRGEVQSRVVVRRRGTLETRMLLRPPSPPQP